MTKTVGLTGGIGSGKTSAANCFAKLGVPIIDTDQIARQLVQPCQPALQKLVEHFSKDILNQNNELDRSKLRNKIISNPTEKKWLESLLHPLIRNEVKRRISALNTTYCIIEIPLLAESYHAYSDLDRILVVEAPVELRVKRAMQRSKLSKEEVHAIIHQQATDEQRSEIANDTIVNDGSLRQLESAIAELDRQYKNL